MIIVKLILIFICGAQLVKCIHWSIRIFVSGRNNADSDGHFYLDVKGTKNDMHNIHLGGNFAKGEYRYIGIDGDLGKIISIRIYQYDDDGLYLTKIVMFDGTREYNFPCNCWIQTDDPASNSRSSWTLSSTNCYWNVPSSNCVEMRKLSCQRGVCKTCTSGYYLKGTDCNRE